MKIGMVSDVHYCALDALPGGRKPQVALARLGDALAAFDREQARLVICLGDLINHEAAPAKDEQNLRHVAQTIKAAGLPCICLMGNHDCEAFLPADFGRVSGLSTTPGTLSIGDVSLHFLDTNYHWDAMPYCPEHVNWEQAFLPLPALEWLERALSDPSRRHYVFSHQCLDPFVESRHIIGNSADIRAVLKRHAVAAVFQGHYHPGAFHQVDGIPYHTLPALCEGDAHNAFLWDTDAAQIVPGLF